ncbi:hypothetical protein K402DRAFT_419788 [Aulographum hederae CBS 113979]|uniref:Uncharacterized protein n=1 Tax=Aulographum hederae CBS 113979 TaxID=1176131 RepID=A0A6G1H4E0_9PEZI|nr:hypothetical protein K402DRAFT_419788 [Aulographum hederae CBS 113979]
MIEYGPASAHNYLDTPTDTFPGNFPASKDIKITCGLAAKKFMEHNCSDPSVKKTTECGPWRTVIQAYPCQGYRRGVWRDGKKVKETYPGKFPGVFPAGKHFDAEIEDDAAVEWIREVLNDAQ